MFVASGQQERIPLDGLPRLPWILLEFLVAAPPVSLSSLARIETLGLRPILQLAADAEGVRVVTARETTGPLAPSEAPVRFLLGWSDTEAAVELLEPTRRFVRCDSPDPAEVTRLVVGGEASLVLRRVVVMRSRPQATEPLPADAIRPLFPFC